MRATFPNSCFEQVVVKENREIETVRKAFARNNVQSGIERYSVQCLLSYKCFNDYNSNYCGNVIVRIALHL